MPHGGEQTTIDGQAASRDPAGWWLLLGRARHGWLLMAANTTALISAIVLLVIAMAAITAPLIAPYSPTAISTDTLLAPSLHHLFGTDELGRDVLSRVLWGAQLTLEAALVGVGISAGFGIPLGLVAGYSTRWLSFIIMRAMDVLLAFPGLLLALLVVTILGSGLSSVMVAIGISFIPVFARVVYGSTLAAKELDYVLAARAVGCGPLHIMVRQILPNVVSHIIVIASGAIGWAILVATTLNFLGFGVHLPTAEWGADLAAGRDWVSTAWWISTFPGLAITITILASSYLGDHLAAILDPRNRLTLSIGRIGAGGE
jgi:ABC-type dipeptide/oligopeptide/nickel transport system permease subunit